MRRSRMGSNLEEQDENSSLLRRAFQNAKGLIFGTEEENTQEVTTVPTQEAPQEGTQQVLEELTQEPDSAQQALLSAIEMTNQVSYKDEDFLRGSGNLTRTETARLLNGSDDIDVANCSTFASWMMARAGMDVRADAENGAKSLKH